MAHFVSDVAVAVGNAHRIVTPCAGSLRLGESFLPEYPVPDGKTMAGFLETVTRAGLMDRSEKFSDAKMPSEEPWQQRYFDRLAFELNVINSMGFPGYFLIVIRRTLPRLVGYQGSI